VKPVVNVVVSILILATGVAGLRFFGQKPDVPTQNADDGDVATIVETKEVIGGRKHFYVKTDGEAATYRVVTVGAEVEGRITHKSDRARGGTFVGKGEVLFEIDPTNYLLEVRRLCAELQQVREEITAVSIDAGNTKALIKLAEEDWLLQKKHLERMQSLLKRKTANETEVESAMKLELTARNSLQTLRNQLMTLGQQRKTREATKALFEAQLERAKVDVERCTVKSLLDGRIVDDLIEEGDYAKSGDVLVHISDGSRMEVKCQLRSEELAWVWSQRKQVGEQHGNSVENVTPVASVEPVDLPQLPHDPVDLPQVPCEIAFVFQGVETIWDGYTSRLEGTGIDRDTRTFPCRILVEEPQKSRVNDSDGGRATIRLPKLLSGMHVAVRISIASPVPLLLLPVEAVRPGEQIWVDRDGRLEIREISLVHTEGPAAFVRAAGSGLQAGDQVIVSPLAVAKKGLLLQRAKESTE
jgi:multidrug efflux pump subunit AcrA (membrane-fusion protein)